MKIVLATGIYPPDIGGPATYVQALASELSRLRNEVSVVTYGRVESGKWKVESEEGWKVVSVCRAGGPFLRWWRYAKVLRKVASDADVIEAFSSVSVGVPLMLARLSKPKKVLRLGGDFFWERYTDGGGMLDLKQWYEHLSEWKIENGKLKMLKLCMSWLLRSFDHIVFSTRFQMEIYERHYGSRLPPHSVIENALPGGQPVLHAAHTPFRLLFMGRFVGFKNLPSLLTALDLLPSVHLTLIGSGPMGGRLTSQVEDLRLGDRVSFLPPVSGADKQRVFAEQDLLILPSLTELSPNVALEARVVGLPVILSQKTGLSTELTQGMVVRPLRTVNEITAALRDVIVRYDEIARSAALPPPKRGWEDVAREHLLLFQSL